MYFLLLEPVSHWAEQLLHLKNKKDCNRPATAPIALQVFTGTHLRSSSMAISRLTWWNSLAILQCSLYTWTLSLRGTQGGTGCKGSEGGVGDIREVRDIQYDSQQYSILFFNYKARWETACALTADLESSVCVQVVFGRWEENSAGTHTDTGEPDRSQVRTWTQTDLTVPFALPLNLLLVSLLETYQMTEIGANKFPLALHWAASWQGPKRGEGHLILYFISVYYFA